MPVNASRASLRADTLSLMYSSIVGLTETPFSLPFDIIALCVATVIGERQRRRGLKTVESTSSKAKILKDQYSKKMRSKRFDFQIRCPE